MVSVATAVLLITGWGSAVASSVRSAATNVIVKNSANNPANVRVANLQAASTQVVLQPAAQTVLAGQSYNVVTTSTDLSAYRSVTLYLSLSLVSPSNPGESCSIFASGPAGGNFFVTSFTTGTKAYYSTTLDPAPPRVRISCTDHSNVSGSFQYSVMLTGRTG